MARSAAFFIGIVFATFFSLYGQEGEVIGTWLNEEGTSHIRVFKATNGSYYGKIEWLKEDPERLDINNPDESKQSEPLLGLIILKGFGYNMDKERWDGGTIYDPDNGKTYDCFMWFDGDFSQLFIKGYVLGMKFIGRETIWNRVEL
jgi:uncharacterized protein (DUF2147 family)